MPTTYYAIHNGPQGTGDGLSVANGMSLQGAADTAVAGDTVRVCATGAYGITTQVDWDTNAGTVNDLIKFIGYDATGAVETLCPITFDTNNATNITKSYLYFRNLQATHANNVKKIWVIGTTARVTFESCKANGGYVGWEADVLGSKYFNCEAYACNLAGFYYVSGYMYGCSSHDNTNAGFAGGLGRMEFCTAYDNGTDGANFNDAAGASVINCIFANNDGDGVEIAGGATSYMFPICNSIMIRNGGYGLKGTAAANVIGFGNLIPSSGADANTTGSTLNITFIGSSLAANLVAGQLAVFNSVADGAEDYILGASSAAKGAGWPGQLPGFAAGKSLGVLDMGACQMAWPVLPAVANVWYGSGNYGYLSALVPTKRASSIANCEAGKITGVTIDDVVGTRVDCPVAEALTTSGNYGDPGAPLVGTYVGPADSDVRLGVANGVAPGAGNVRVPAVAKVEDGYFYDTLDSLTGTLAAGGGGALVNSGLIVT